MRGGHPQTALAQTIRHSAHNVRARCREGWHTLSLRQNLTENVMRETWQKKPWSITDLQILMFAMETRLEQVTSKDCVRRQPDES